MFRDILRVGAVAAITSVQTNVTIALDHRAGRDRGRTGAVAGFGTGARLEYLLVPLVFGLGAPLVALVGTNIGAGQRAAGAAHRLDRRRDRFRCHRSHRHRGGAFGRIAWLTLFSTDPRVIEAGSAYLRMVGPSYGFFGFGLALYFASQGAGTTVLAAVGRAFRAWRSRSAAAGSRCALTGSLHWLFAALALGLVVYGVTVLTAVASGAWFRDAPAAKL